MTPHEREVWLQTQEKALETLWVNMQRQWQAVPRRPDSFAGIPALRGMNDLPPVFPSNNDIGYGSTRWPWWVYPSGPNGIVENVASDVSLLDTCRLAFVGLNSNRCGSVMEFDAADWGDVSDWIDAGGRLWINGEWYIDESENCMSDGNNVNNFLAAIGSTISILPGYHNCDSPEDPLWKWGLPGPARIARYSRLQMACTGEVTGGTTVWFAPDGAPMVKGERINDGFVFVCGDGNVAHNEYPNTSINGAFAQRLYNYADDEIL